MHASRVCFAGKLDSCMPLGCALLVSKIPIPQHGVCSVCFMETRRRTGLSLSEPQREAVYTLYQRYEQMKAMNRDWDIADRTLHIHQQLHRHGFPASSKFDFIYVDEVSASGHAL